jgi:hypothetical protein
MFHAKVKNYLKPLKFFLDVKVKFTYCTSRKLLVFRRSTRFAVLPTTNSKPDGLLILVT